ncbi:hypothetical protein EVAR_68258_1 [Eumeta japonica]|uniref:Uncharacterized protein n=1 Tax=Eumeta variegata TaxID=151549 RepID=A0A4C1ZRJ5_EUMVA|nr:hypothetical protein EVAR_68258_1 [Eumeta japonica]
MVTKISDYVKIKGMKANANKMNVIVFERSKSMTERDICAEGERVEQMEEFVYLDNLFTNDSKHDRDTKRKANAGNKVNKVLFPITNIKIVTRQARLAIHNGIPISTITYGSERWV